MESRLDPNDNFLNSRPNGFFDPLDPSILTQPGWINVFLTPGASFATRTPVSTTTSVNTAVTVTPTLKPALSITPLPTRTIIVVFPTSTKKFVPSPTRTSTLISSTSSTPSPTPTPLDLQITKTDGSNTYTAGSIVTYTVIVTNNGPNNVAGAVVRDNIPAQVTSWDWVCTTVTNAGGCNGVTGSTANFTDTVNIQSGGNIRYTVTANINAAATGNLVNTASVNVPSGYTDTNGGNNSATDTDTLSVSTPVDLQITKDDGVTTYGADDSITYTINVSNNGPNDMSGATVTDDFSTNSNIASANWSCLATGSATCTTSGSGNINDTVNVPVGSSLTYAVTVNIVSSPSGNLVNTASVSVPSGYTDTNTGNNSATDTDTLVIGTDPDGIVYLVPEGSSLTLALSSPLVANGDIGTWDLVYYELPAFPPPNNGINLDLVQIDISIDGVNNWITIFNWGDNIIDPNTNLTLYLQNNPQVPPEPDERPIPASTLYTSSSGYPTGIAIDIDSIAPPGTYYFIRFYAPPDNNDHVAEIDAIEILP